MWRWAAYIALIAWPAAAADLTLPGDLPGAPDAPAEPPPDDEPPEPTVNGLWQHARPDGLVEHLELFGKQRFLYRTSAGEAVGGDLVADARRLRLRYRGSERVFLYDLQAATLRLTPDSDDQPAGRGPLDAMWPRGAETAVYHRRGSAEQAWELALASPGDLVGDYRLRSAAGREERLDLRLDGRFRYIGPGDVAAEGRYQLEDGLLVFSSAGVERRLRPRVRITAASWVLTLARDEADRPRYLNDLADMPPRLRTAARWERPLVDVAEDDLLGNFHLTDDLGEHRLVFAPRGQLRVGSLPGQIVPGEWRLEGALLTLTATNDVGVVEARRFVVQPVPGGLLLVRDDRDEPLRGELLRYLPPLTEPYARYTPF